MIKANLDAELDNIDLNEEFQPPKDKFESNRANETIPLADQTMGIPRTNKSNALVDNTVGGANDTVDDILNTLNNKPQSALVRQATQEIK